MQVFFIKIFIKSFSCFLYRMGLVLSINLSHRQIVMYYAQKNVNKGTVLNPSVTAEYWAFENKAQRDQAVMSNPMMYSTLKQNIPEGAVIRTFNHFKESFTGLYLIPVEG